MIIDSQVHYVPKPFYTMHKNWLRKQNRDRKRGSEAIKSNAALLLANPAIENIGQHFDDMRINGIEKAVINPGLCASYIMGDIIEDDIQRLMMVRYMNDSIIQVARDCAYDLIPLAYIDPRLGYEAIVEMQRMNANCGGFSLLSGYINDCGNLKYLNSIEFSFIWRSASMLGRPIFIHPSYLFEDKNSEPFLNKAEQSIVTMGLYGMIETSLLVTHLVYSGILDEYPNLKIVLPSLGGLYPMLFGRLDVFTSAYKKAFPDAESKPNGIRNLRRYIKNFYVTTSSMESYEVQAAVAALGVEHVLFGSDFPICPSRQAREEAIKSLLVLSKSEREMVMCKNAIELFEL